MDFLVRGKYILTNSRRYGDQGILPDAAVYVSERQIVEVAPYKDLKASYPNAAVIGSSRFWVTPGFVSAHQHGKGLTNYQLGGIDDCFELSRVSGGPYAKVDTYFDTLYSCLKMIEAGVTCCMHFNSSRGPKTYATDIKDRLRAYRKSGLRISFGLDIRNRNHLVYGDDKFIFSLPKKLQDRAREEFTKPRTASPEDYFHIAGRLSDGIDKDSDGRIRLFLTPAGPQWCTEDLLRAIRREADERNLGIQMHVLETKYQRSYFLRTYGKSAVRWLDELDFLGPRTSFAHGVWVNQEDAAVLAMRGTAVVHNPSSNLRLKCGIAPIPMLHGAGVTLALGLDSSALNDAPDLLQEMRLCANLQRIPGVDSKPVPLIEIFRLGTVNGSNVLGWGQFAGALEPGMRADMVLLDAKAFTEPYVAPHQNPIHTLIYRGNTSAIDTVMVDGDILYQGKKHLKLQPKEIIQNLKKSIRMPAPEDDEDFGNKLLPYMLQYYQSWDKDELSPFHLVNSTI